MSELFKVSQSKIDLYRKCHYAYYWRYVKGISKLAQSPYLERGIMFHACLESYAETGNWKRTWKALSREYYSRATQSELNECDVASMVHNLLENYFQCYSETDYEKNSHVESERYFETEIADNIVLKGTIDEVRRDTKTGKLSLMDHKTYSDFNKKREELVYNQQAYLYFHGAEAHYGEKPKEFIWNIIRAKVPSNPKLLKNGKVSKASIDTTPFAVVQWLHENKLNPDDYQDLIEKGDYDKYFSRIHVPYNKFISKQILKDTISTAKEMRNRQFKNKRFDRNLGYGCRMCDYSKICHAELLGLNPQLVITSDYIDSDKKEELDEKRAEAYKKAQRKAKRNRK